MITTGSVFTSRALRMALIVGALLFSGFFFQDTVAASSIYGQGTYGECRYQRDCPTTPAPTTPTPSAPPTVTTTPSGLEVAINLTNDQVLPRTGYLVTLTPLNGRGETFQQALIYIDDQYVATVYPGSNGTGEWFWDTIRYPGTNIRFVITDQTGQTTTQTFRIRIAKEGEPVGAVTPSDETPQTESSNPLVVVTTAVTTAVTAAVTQAGEALEKFVLFLPKEIAYAFPWIIFILISTQIIIFILHSRREAKALNIAKSATERLRTLGTMKSDFINLLAHHLRTPLTTLQGGLELQSSDSGKESTAPLEAVARDIHTTIDTILADAEKDVEPARPFSTQHPTLRSYLPFITLLIGAGVLAFGFLFLANTITAITTSQVDLIVQILVYLLLSTFALICLRIFKLREAERNRLEAILTQERALQDARDTAIERIDQRLRQHIAKLDKLMTSLPSTGMGIDFIKPAYADLTKLSDKCYIATQLSDSKDKQPPSAYSFTALYNPIDESLQSAANERHVSLTANNEGTIETSEPELLSVVLKSVLENAIAYAPENTVVATSITDDKGSSKITVRDRGKGFNKEQLAQLFQPFYKAEGSETYDHPGMGFSLYLDKLIMTYLGGTIEASSEPESQTEFTITLPRRATASN